MNSTTTSNLTIAIDVPYNAVPMRNWEFVYRSVVGALAVIVNATIVTTICFSRQLHSPRHLYWAAVSVTYLASTAQWIVESVGMYSGDSWLACRIYVTFASVHHTANSLYLMLAACDRLVAIRCYAWYKKRVTTKRLLVVLIGVYALVIASVTSPLWLGIIVPSSCTINLLHMYCVITVNLVVSVASLALNLTVFTSSKRLLAVYVASRAASSNKKMSAADGAGADDAGQSHLDNLAATVGRRTVSFQCPLSLALTSTRSSPDELSELELKASLSLSVNIMPMWFCQVPLALNTMALYWFVTLGKDVALIATVNVLLRNVYHAFLVYNPIMFICVSRGFWRALLRLLDKFVYFIRTNYP